MIHILKGARADPKFIEAVKHFRCPDCLEDHTRAQPVKAPSLYIFNYEFVVDVLEVKDAGKGRYGCVSGVCNGTTFHLVGGVRWGWPTQEREMSEEVPGWLVRLGWLAEDPDARPRVPQSGGAFGKALSHDSERCQCSSKCGLIANSSEAIWGGRGVCGEVVGD